MKGTLHLVFPPQCMGCGETISSDGALCPNCWRETDFISGLACTACGCPLPGEAPDPARASQPDPVYCDDCLRQPRPWVGGRAAVVYSGVGRNLCLMLKHGDRLDLAPHLGDWLARAAAPLIVPGMIVTAVPIHLRRLFKRKYNQASQLSARVARAHALPHHPDLLKRSRYSPPQDRRDATARFANQADSITLPSRHLALLKDRPVLVIDDVMSSGATLTAVTDCLIAAGAGPISVAVLARAVKDT